MQPGKILGRGPTAGEKAECLSYLSEQSRKLSPVAPESSSDRARTDLIHVLFNHNDFVTIR